MNLDLFKYKNLLSEYGEGDSRGVSLLEVNISNFSGLHSSLLLWIKPVTRIHTLVGTKF